MKPLLTRRQLKSIKRMPNGNVSAAALRNAVADALHVGRKDPEDFANVAALRLGLSQPVFIYTAFKRASCPTHRQSAELIACLIGVPLWALWPATYAKPSLWQRVREALA